MVYLSVRYSLSLNLSQFVEDQNGLAIGQNHPFSLCWQWWVVYPNSADNSLAPKTGYNAPISQRFGGGKAMVSPLFDDHLVLLALVWLFVIVHLTWPKRAVRALAVPPTPEPLTPKRPRANEPTPFEGLTKKPHCALCERDTAHPKAPALISPAPMAPTKRRPREVDSSQHFCPHAGCDFWGWRGLGNLRANGHPSGGPWRQFHCTACNGYF